MKKTIIILATLAIVAMPMLASAQATIPEVCADIECFYNIACTAIDWIFGFVLLGAVIVILFGAVSFFTARGNEDQVASARRYVTYALVGVAVAVLAKSLVYVVGSFVGADPSGFFQCTGA